MLRGRTATVAAAFAIAAAAVGTAGCGGGSTSSALSLDPVAAAATKTQNAGAARVRLALALSGPNGKSFRVRGTGAIDGTSTEMSFKLGSMLGLMGLHHGGPEGLLARLSHASIKEVALEQNGDYGVYLRLGSLLSSQLPGGQQWIKLDLTTLGKSAGVDLGKLMSASQFQPTDLLSMLKAVGAQVQKVGPATIAGVATTQYRVKIDLAKVLQAKGLTTPLLSRMATKLKAVTENVWVGKDGLVRRVQLAYGSPQAAAHLGMTMDLFDYGARVDIAAPPSSQVFDATQFALQGLGSTLH